MANTPMHKPNNNQWVTAPYTGTSVTYSSPITFPDSNDKYPQKQTLESFFNDMFFLGFNDQIKRWNTLVTLPKPTTFPPHNLIKVEEGVYKVELAVAGYSKDDIEVTVDRDLLIVSSKLSEDEEEDDTILYQGIAQRQWTKKFILGEFMEVVGATVKDGLLTINVSRNIPDEALPKKIKVK